MSSGVKKITADVLVLGAGIIGSSIVMALAKQGVQKVLAVDLDLGGEWSSSELNAGGVRATWSQEVNLLTSKFSIEYFETVAEAVGYRACGYLWLHRQNTFESALKAREMHVAHGWAVDMLDIPALQKKAPFIDKTKDLAGALYGVRDGLLNPNRLKEHYREVATQSGAQFLDGTWVLSSNLAEMGSGKKATLKAFRFKQLLNSQEKRSLLVQNPKLESDLDLSLGEIVEIEADHIVNAGGAWAPEFAKILAYTSPSSPLRRQISIFHGRDLDLKDSGMIIDPSGVYFHPESIYGLSGFATVGEQSGFNFEYEKERFFEEQIWPALSERSTQFESLKHVNGWAGLYENSPDHHAIVGRVNALSSASVYEAHSFSGHGVMQSYGIGVALAELICKGRYETLDLSELSADRFASGKKIPSETWVI